MNDDCISRQAVIKAMYDLCADGKDRTDNPWRDNPNIDAIIDAIENLPSVQPINTLDMQIQLDAAHDDGYEQGYLQAKTDYEVEE